MVAAGYCLGKNVQRVQLGLPETNDQVNNNTFDCGEDAFFVHQEKGAIGVADGVGSWSVKGVDPGEIARKLMGNSRDAIVNGEKDPRNALAKAYNNIIDKKQVKAGIECLIFCVNLR